MKSKEIAVTVGYMQKRKTVFIQCEVLCSGEKIVKVDRLKAIAYRAVGPIPDGGTINYRFPGGEDVHVQN